MNVQLADNRHRWPDQSAHGGQNIAFAIVNAFGFLNHSRYMPDRRDLNRSFPGSDQGSLTSLLADLFFREVVKRAQYGIDLHTAALHRTNLPQIRIAPGDSDLMKLAEAFAPPVIMTSKLREGSLRQSAKNAGVKVILYEGGEALRFEEPAIEAGVKGTLRVMKHIGMIENAPNFETMRRVSPSCVAVDAIDRIEDRPLICWKSRSQTICRAWIVGLTWPTPMSRPEIHSPWRLPVNCTTKR